MDEMTKVNNNMKCQMFHLSQSVLASWAVARTLFDLAPVLSKKTLSLNPIDFTKIIIICF
jgi:hypothetical protein